MTLHDIHSSDAKVAQEILMLIYIVFIINLLFVPVVNPDNIELFPYEEEDQYGATVQINKSYYRF